MKHTILGNMIAAMVLCPPLAACAESLTYYDCMNADGSMSYRVLPCNKGQQEMRRQKDSLRASEAPLNVDMPPAAVNGAESENPVPEPDGAQQDFAAGEIAYKLEKYGEAAVLYRKSADQGFAPAQFSMGVMYDIGQGVAQDYRQALLWYAKAAEQGNAKAQNNLGFMYSQGKGTAQDYVTAHMWFNISGARGYAEGRKNREYVEGLMSPSGIAEAQQKAAEWMKAHP